MSTPSQQTLIFVRNRDHVLLGLKKTGFASGTWNGYGGKALPGESAVECAVRELEEESKLRVTQHDLCAVGVLRVQLGGATSNDRHVHLFTIDYESLNQVAGEPCETTEMRPKWFHVDEIPYGEMLPDASRWLPALLDGKRFDVTVRQQDNGFTDIQFSN